MMQSTCPFFTVEPISTNEADPRLRRSVERPDDRRLDDRELDLAVVRNGSRRGRRGHGRCRGRRQRYRLRVGGRGRRQGHECAGRILPDLEAQPLLFDLELGQLVLAHEVENLLQLIQVQSDLQQGRRDVRQQLRPAWRHHDVVFDAHPPIRGSCAPGSMVNTMPAARASSWLSTSERLRAMRGPRDLETQAMTGPVTECRPHAFIVEDGPRGLVDREAGAPGRTAASA